MIVERGEVAGGHEQRQRGNWCEALSVYRSLWGEVSG